MSGDLTNKKIKEAFRDLVHLDNSNSGVTGTLKALKTGNGNTSSIFAATNTASVKGASDNTATFTVKDKDGNNIFLVDTTNNRVKVGSGQVDASTGIKEFGLYDYSPTAGYHNPMVSMNGLTSTSGSLNEVDDSMFENGPDPATALDLSANGTNKVLLNSLWYLPYNITIQEVRVWGAADGNQALNFHLYSYDITVDTSNFGDLSNGTLLAHIGSSMTATSTSLLTDTLTIDSASVASSKAVFAFVEGETDTTDITCTMTIKYRID